MNPFSSIFLRNSLKDSPAWIAKSASKRCEVVMEEKQEEVQGCEVLE